MEVWSLKFIRKLHFAAAVIYNKKLLASLWYGGAWYGPKNMVDKVLSLFRLVSPKFNFRCDLRSNWYFHDDNSTFAVAFFLLFSFETNGWHKATAANILDLVTSIQWRIFKKVEPASVNEKTYANDRDCIESPQNWSSLFNDFICSAVFIFFISYSQSSFGSFSHIIYVISCHVPIQNGYFFLKINFIELISC